jgi:hypothetical protein
LKTHKQQNQTERFADMFRNIQPRYFIFFILIAIALSAFADTVTEKLKWTGVQSLMINGGEIKTLSFYNSDNAVPWGLLPVYTRKFDLPASGLRYEFEISNPEFIPLEYNDISEIADTDLISDTLLFTSNRETFRNNHHIVFRMLPLRVNPATGQIEKLVSFDLSYVLQPGGQTDLKDNPVDYAENSVLSTGDWFKISVSENGIHKVTWQHLSDLGMNMTDLQSEKIRLFGNGGGMLPQENGKFRYDDLVENAILVFDGDDGTFDQGDYFLFYGQSPNTWKLSTTGRTFEHSKHKFSLKNHYFINRGELAGKRIEESVVSPFPAETIINTYNDYASHEEDLVSLIKSGAEWYGEEFNDELTKDFYFPFPNRDVTKDVHITCDLAARSTTTSSFTAFINSDSVFRDNVGAISEGSITKYANPSKKSSWFMANTTPDLTVTLNYNRNDNKSVGWLNYITINVISNLKFDGHQFLFRNIDAHVNKELCEYRISNANTNLQVWDITAPLLPQQVPVTFEDGFAKYTIQPDSLREFIAFDGTDFMEPGLLGAVPNQNLHAHNNAEFIIVTHPDFADQAMRLKELHQEIDGMEVIVADLYEVYNEFSSGTPDVTAIRDFVRMVYLRSFGTPHALKYLLLFGDGSYDPFNRVGGNLSFIPAFQSKQSLWFTSTYVTDDYFGLMDSQEGNDASGNVDIGIGRFAVNSPEEADLMVDKVESYMRMTPEVQGNWRNSMTFIADDEDNNLHLLQADTVLVSRIQRKNKTVNISKVYLDAYRQETTASGETYPQVNIDINKKINDGTLIVNYTGHGGELGLSHEKVVQISDILSWNNSDMLSVFITATCEFSRFDNPALTSAGELVLLNQNGGAIALYTTTRLAFASANLLLNKRLYDTLFSAYPETHPRLGDLMMFSKTPSNTNLRNFVLLGNPALRLALPGYKVVTDSINGIPADQFNDTLNASGHLTVSGHIESYIPGGLVEDFNGTIYPVLYDKPTAVTTLGNDPTSYPYTFEALNSTLCKGKATVSEGRFKFSFVLPLDISYHFGNGKLSYYAADSTRDAGGYYSDLIIGGIADGAYVDNTGPEIEVFLNEWNSALPGQVNTDPVMYAKLADPSGINHLGTGIGHDIVLTMDGPLYDSYILNDSFEQVMDDHTTGTLTFPMKDLPNGSYTLELKAWDMLNNSSTRTIDFSVSDNIEVDLLEVYNYPNPFKDHTWITFRHNQFGEDLTIEIDIYDFYGQHVRTIGPENVFTNGYAVEPVLWEGDTEGGSKLKPGFYFYHLKVSNEKNQSAERIQKLIITE